MFKLLKSSVAAAALSAIAVAPIVVVLTADAAYAKSEKGNSGGGGGNEKGNGGSNGSGGSNGKSSGAKSNGNEAAAKTSKSKPGNASGLLGLFKKNTVMKTKSAGAVTQKSKEKGPLHPSKLGNMNGAINSSPNAKLAHIRNGNFNGPVGLAAALAVAEYQYETALQSYDEAQNVLALAEAWDVINGAPTADELAAATSLTEGTEAPSADAIAAAQALVDAGDEAAAGYAEATGTLALASAWDVVNTAPTEDQLAAAQVLADGTEVPTDDAVIAAEAIAALGGPSTGDVVAVETALVDAWNKGDHSVTDPEAVAMLTAVRGSLPSDEDIAKALVAQNQAGDLDGAVDLDGDTEVVVVVE